MTSGFIGQPSGSVIVPVTSFTKQTVWVPLVLTTDITCPQTGFAVTKCLAQFSADSAGQWVVELLAQFTWDSATVTSVVVTLPNMTMYNGFSQEMQAELIGKALAMGARADSNASTITLTCASTATTTGAYISGRVALKANPMLRHPAPQLFNTFFTTDSFDVPHLLQMKEMDPSSGLVRWLALEISTHSPQPEHQTTLTLLFFFMPSPR